jgi:hypothetical protein
MLVPPLEVGSVQFNATLLSPGVAEGVPGAEGVPYGITEED